MTGAISWFVKNPVAANLMMTVMVVGGFFTLIQLTQEEFPAIDPEAVQIVVEYRGASPAEVEESICIRVEEAIKGTPDLDRISTMASEGICVVTAEILVGADVTAAAAEIENRIDAIDTFPADSERPLVSKVEVRRPVLRVALSGPLTEHELKRLGQRARDEIANLPGVSQVVLQYDRDYEVSIEVSEATLRRHGIDLNHVAEAVRSFSLDLPGGSVKTGGGEILRPRHRRAHGCGRKRVPRHGAYDQCSASRRTLSRRQRSLRRDRALSPDRAHNRNDLLGPRSLDVRSLGAGGATRPYGHRPFLWRALRLGDDALSGSCRLSDRRRPSCRHCAGRLAIGLEHFDLAWRLRRRQPPRPTGLDLRRRMLGLDT